MPGKIRKQAGASISVPNVSQAARQGKKTGQILLPAVSKVSGTAGFQQRPAFTSSRPHCGTLVQVDASQGQDTVTIAPASVTAISLIPNQNQVMQNVGPALFPEQFPQLTLTQAQTSVPVSGVCIQPVTQGLKPATSAQIHVPVPQISKVQVPVMQASVSGLNLQASIQRQNLLAVAQNSSSVQVQPVKQLKQQAPMPIKTQVRQTKLKNLLYMRLTFLHCSACLTQFNNTEAFAAHVKQQKLHGDQKRPVSGGMHCEATCVLLKILWKCSACGTVFGQEKECTDGHLEKGRCLGSQQSQHQQNLPGPDQQQSQCPTSAAQPQELQYKAGASQLQPYFQQRAQLVSKATVPQQTVGAQYVLPAYQQLHCTIGNQPQQSKQEAVILQQQQTLECSSGQQHQQRNLQQPLVQLQHVQQQQQQESQLPQCFPQQQTQLQQNLAQIQCMPANQPQGYTKQNNQTPSDASQHQVNISMSQPNLGKQQQVPSLPPQPSNQGAHTQVNINVSQSVSGEQQMTDPVHQSVMQPRSATDVSPAQLIPLPAGIPTAKPVQPPEDRRATEQTPRAQSTASPKELIHSIASTTSTVESQAHHGQMAMLDAPSRLLGKNALKTVKEPGLENLSQCAMKDAPNSTR